METKSCENVQVQETGTGIGGRETGRRVRMGYWGGGIGALGGAGVGEYRI